MRQNVLKTTFLNNFNIIPPQYIQTYLDQHIMKEKSDKLTYPLIQPILQITYL